MSRLCYCSGTCAAVPEGARVADTPETLSITNHSFSWLSAPDGRKQHAIYDYERTTRLVSLVPRFPRVSVVLKESPDQEPLDLDRAAPPGRATHTRPTAAAVQDLPRKQR